MLRWTLLSVLFCLAPAAARAELPVGLRDVPADAAMFWHADMKALLKSPLVKEVRKGLGKIVEDIIDSGKKEGLDIDKADTITAYFPKFPMGPGDEKMYVLTLHFSAPYDKAHFYPKDRIGEEKNGTIYLKGDVVIKLIDDKTVVYTHKKLAEEMDGGMMKKPTTGVMTKAIEAAAKRHFVQAIDLGALPDELKKNPAEQLRPFLPLFNARMVCLEVDADKTVAIDVGFLCESEDKTKTVKGSLDLLMKLAKAALDQIMASKDKDTQAMVPALKSLKQGMDGMKIAAADNYVNAQMEVGADFPVSEYLKSIVDRLQGARSRAQSTNNLKQIALAIHNYASKYGGFPPSAICDRKGKKLLSWRVAILPFIEQEPLYKEFKLDEPWDSEHNKKLIEKMPAVFRSPNDDEKSMKTRYKLFTGNGACFDVVKMTKLIEITDGTSNTIMVAAAAEAVEWSKPDDIDYDPKAEIAKLLLWEEQGTTVAFCDGSVRFLSKKIQVETWHWLIQKADGHVIPALDP